MSVTVDNDFIKWLLSLDWSTISPMSAFIVPWIIVGTLWHKNKICPCSDVEREKAAHEETKKNLGSDLAEAKEAAKLSYIALDKEKERYIETRIQLEALRTQAEYGWRKREE